MVAGKKAELVGHVHVGKITKPQGIRGEVKVFCMSGQPDNLRAYSHLVLVDEGGRQHDYTVTKCRVQGNAAIAALAGVSDRNRAEELVGWQVWVAEDDLAPLADDEFYWHDVMGAEVVDRDGNSLGTLTSLMNTAGAELMVVRQKEEEVLIPYQSEFLVEIGPERIVVDLPPGLLDINRKQ